MVLLGNPKDSAKIEPIAMYPSRKIARLLHVLLIPDRGRMPISSGFKDLVFLSPKLSSVSFWNKDLVSLQGGGDGGDTAKGQRNTCADNWLSAHIFRELMFI